MVKQVQIVLELEELYYRLVRFQQEYHALLLEWEVVMEQEVERFVDTVRVEEIADCDIAKEGYGVGSLVAPEGTRCVFGQQNHDSPLVTEL